MSAPRPASVRSARAAAAGSSHRTPQPAARRRRPTLLLAAALLAVLPPVAGCRRAGDPVARLEVAPQAFRLGYPEVRRLHLAWEPLAPLGDRPVSPIVFVHLLDADGRVVRTFDHPFPRPWRPGAPVDYAIELYQSALAPGLPAGSYPLTVGLYRPGGERWPLATTAADRGRHEYEVGVVEVPAGAYAALAGGPAAPRFGFTGAWDSPRPGTDSQVLAYRWLSGEGAVTVTGLAAAGRVWMLLEVPDPGGTSSLLVLAADARSQSLMVTTNCGDAMTSVSGPGRHAVAFPLDPAAAGEGGVCEVRLAPSFYLVTTGVPVQRVAALEVLAWMPDDGASGPAGR